MPKAERSNSTRTPPPPPPEDVINTTLDASGRGVLSGLDAMFRPEEITAFKSVFLTRHAIADEIERLLAVLDAIDGCDDLELNLGGYHWNPDPRLDDAEGDAADDEPSLAGFGTGPVSQYFADCEDDPSECGLGDLDGMEEQLGRCA